MKAIQYQSYGGYGENRLVDFPQPPLKDVTSARALHLNERKRAEEEHERLRQLESEFAHMNRVSMMGELAASLAHEILHPIATARNNARASVRFLEMSPPNLDEVRKALDCVVKDVDRARDIVDRMRDQIKKAPPRREPFDLNEAVSEVIVMVRSAITTNGIAVRTHLKNGLVSVQGDRVQLQQVLENLILNAVDAMSSIDAGVRELSITTRQEQTQVLVAVGDSGPGIAREHLDRVFKPFYTTKPSGIGIGCSSADPSSKLTADDCGQAPTSPAAPCFSSRCLPIRTSRRNRPGGGETHVKAPMEAAHQEASPCKRRWTRTCNAAADPS